MSWYDPTYGYDPGEIARELGLEPEAGAEVAPADRPAPVYAGPFRPERPGATTLAVPSREPRALATTR